MPAIKKAKSNMSYGGGAIVSDDIKNHANDPVINRKNDKARIAVRKLTLPASGKK